MQSVACGFDSERIWADRIDRTFDSERTHGQWVHSESNVRSIRSAQIHSESNPHPWLVGAFRIKHLINRMNPTCYYVYCLHCLCFRCHMVSNRSSGVDCDYRSVGDSISNVSCWLGCNCRSNVVYYTERNSVVVQKTDNSAPLWPCFFDSCLFLF